MDFTRKKLISLAIRIVLYPVLIGNVFIGCWVYMTRASGDQLRDVLIECFSPKSLLFWGAYISSAGVICLLTIKILITRTSRKIFILPPVLSFIWSLAVWYLEFGVICHGDLVCGSEPEFAEIGAIFLFFVYFFLLLIANYIIVIILYFYFKKISRQI